MHSFSFPTNISFGAGVVSQLADHLKQRSLHRPLIVTDGVVKELPFFKGIMQRLVASGIDPLVFSEINKNPVKSDVVRGKEAYSNQRDSIVGLGGGSAIDVARAVALSINNHRDLFDYDDLAGGGRLIDGEIPYFITIPTTSGTGSEVGRAAIISEDDTKRKRILFHPDLMAKHVFADPELTYDLPPEITAATGMDALTHHMEAFLAKGYNPMCDGIALEGIHIIMGTLEKAVHKPDEKSRSQMMLASLMGAVAFQKGLGIVHSLSHPLSTLLDMHHGLANAINLPYGMAFNAPVSEDRFQRMAQHMGLPHGDDIPKALKDLNQSLGIPLKLSQCGVTPEHIENLAALAYEDFCLPLNPREATIDHLRDIYKSAL